MELKEEIIKILEYVGSKHSLDGIDYYDYVPETELIERIYGLVEANYTKKQKDGIEWMDEWLALFPSGVKTGGKLIKSDKKGCIKKMQKFLKDYPEFNKELILKATESYLEDRAEDNFMYCMAAIYFINKEGRGSELASRCSEILQKGDKVKPNKNNTNYFI